LLLDGRENGREKVECIRGKTSVEIDAGGLNSCMADCGDALADIGTGDGRYVLREARTRPDRFVVGVHANRDNLRRASRTTPPTRSCCPVN
jgi:tRNA G46 methylase TrmB